MLKSWRVDEVDGSMVDEREHWTVKGVIRRLRKLQRAGRIGHGEDGCGGYIVAVEQYPGQWKGRE